MSRRSDLTEAALAAVTAGGLIGATVILIRTGTGVGEALGFLGAIVGAAAAVSGAIYIEDRKRRQDRAQSVAWIVRSVDEAAKELSGMAEYSKSCAEMAANMGVPPISDWPLVRPRLVQIVNLLDEGVPESTFKSHGEWREINGLKSRISAFHDLYSSVEIGTMEGGVPAFNASVAVSLEGLSKRALKIIDDVWSGKACRDDSVAPKVIRTVIGN